MQENQSLFPTDIRTFVEVEFEYRILCIARLKCLRIILLKGIGCKDLYLVASPWIASDSGDCSLDI